MKGLTGRQGGHRTAVDEDPVPRGHMHTHAHTPRPTWAPGEKAHGRAEHGCVREGEGGGRGAAGATGESAEWLISEPRLPKLSL